MIQLRALRLAEWSIVTSGMSSRTLNILRELGLSGIGSSKPAKLLSITTSSSERNIPYCGRTMILNQIAKTYQIWLTCEDTKWATTTLTISSEAQVTSLPASKVASIPDPPTSISPTSISSSAPPNVKIPDPEFPTQTLALTPTYTIPVPTADNVFYEQDTPHSHSLSNSYIIGIGIGGVAFLAITGILVFWLCRRNRKPPPQVSEPTPPPEAAELGTAQYMEQKVQPATAVELGHEEKYHELEDSVINSPTSAPLPADTAAKTEPQEECHELEDSIVSSPIPASLPVEGA